MTLSDCKHGAGKAIA